jgi:hypothetical protein
VAVDEGRGVGGEEHRRADELLDVEVVEEYPVGIVPVAQGAEALPLLGRERVHGVRRPLDGGPWTTWWDAEDDRANADWHRAVTAALRPYQTGLQPVEVVEEYPVGIVPVAQGAEALPLLGRERVHDAEDDRANADWHRAVTAALRPYQTGTYIGESDTVETRSSTPCPSAAPARRARRRW